VESGAGENYRKLAARDLRPITGMVRLPRTLVGLLALASAAILPAQPGFPRHTLTAGFGAGVPRGELRPLFTTSPALRFGYGYRFHENFQADIALDTVFYAADVRDLFPSVIGDLRIRDYQFLLPLGGRAVLPLAAGRVQFSAGGGGAYMRYQERIRQPFGESYFRLECTSCRSRSGWGYYALLGASVALDRYQHFRLGVTSRVYRGNTEGDPFGPLPPVRTRDHWVNTAGEFTFAF
jgi:hypothetical protein